MDIRIPITELQKCKLFLATPMYSGACAGMFARSVADLSALCTAHKISLQLYFLFNESLITRARNYCCDEFMRSEATHLMFIDSDIGFNAQDVLGLLALSADPNSGYDIIGGPYPKKCISWEKIKMAVDKGMADKNPNDLEKFVGDYVFNPKANQTQIQINQPVEVREIGTGFMMAQKQAMEKYAKAFPSLSYKPDHVRTEHFDGSREIHAFFDTVIDYGYTFDDVHRLMEKVAQIPSADLNSEGKDRVFFEVAKEAQKLLDIEKTASRRYLSEDYMFCQYADRIGLKIWFCPWMRLQHVGTYVFGGSLADLAAIGAPATADGGALKAHRESKNQVDEALPIFVDPAKAKAIEKRKKKAEKNADWKHTRALSS